MLTFSDTFTSLQEYDQVLSMIDMPAYVKANIIDNEPVWSVYTEDGKVIGSAPSQYLAEALALRHDMKLATLQ